MLKKNALFYIGMLALQKMHRTVLYTIFSVKTLVGTCTTSNSENSIFDENAYTSCIKIKMCSGKKTYQTIINLDWVFVY